MRSIFYTATILGIVVGLSACSSPTSVAEKALKLVGVGTFVPSDVDRYLGRSEPLSTIGLFTDYASIFDNALIHSDEAENFLNSGVYSKIANKVYFSFSDIMFSNYRLISEEGEITYDIRDIFDFSTLDELTVEAIKRGARLHSGYQEFGTIATWIEGENIPAYVLRYNLDNRYIANITVLKLPNKGYRVCAFRIE